MIGLDHLFCTGEMRESEVEFCHISAKLLGFLNQVNFFPGIGDLKGCNHPGDSSADDQCGRIDFDRSFLQAVHGTEPGGWLQ